MQYEQPIMRIAGYIGGCHERQKRTKTEYRKMALWDHALVAHHRDVE